MFFAFALANFFANLALLISFRASLSARTAALGRDFAPGGRPRFFFGAFVPISAFEIFFRSIAVYSAVPSGRLFCVSVVGTDAVFWAFGLLVSAVHPPVKLLGMPGLL